jgi:hypothetical protein
MRLATTPALIGDGGPLRQLEARCHLVTPRSQIAIALLVAWLPLVVLGVGYEQVTGMRVPLIHDVAVHVRLLVATPLLLFLDRMFSNACTHVVDQLVSDSFVRPAERDRFERLVDRTRRSCAWWLPEAMIAAVAFILGCATLLVVDPVRGLHVRAGLTVADWWYALVGVPLFELLLFRSLWRWLLWMVFLIGLSRLDLDLDASHPDQRCGISFLRKPSVAYCGLVLFAMSAVLSAGWSERFQLSTLTSFIPFLLALAAVAILIAFGPLGLFAFSLHRARLYARDLFGGLAVRNGRWFRERWIGSAPGEAITSNDAQSLGAIGSIYRDTIKQVRLVLFEKKDLLFVLVATLLPVVPTMLLRLPRDEWQQMASFLFSKGGFP